jgi:hypothetical protein
VLTENASQLCQCGGDEACGQRRGIICPVVQVRSYYPSWATASLNISTKNSDLVPRTKFTPIIYTYNLCFIFTHSRTHEQRSNYLSKCL